MFLFLLRERQVILDLLRGVLGLQFVNAVVITVFLFQFLLILLVFAVLLVLQEQPFPELVSLFLRESVERIEILLVIFHDGLIDDFVLNLRGWLITLEDQEDKRFEEVLLLTEILLILLRRNLERIHGDGMFLGVRDIGTMEGAAYPLIGITRINHHNVRVLFQQLAHHAVHVEVF